MNLPANGKYLIRSRGGSLIGANKDNSDVKRVVTFGDMEQVGLLVLVQRQRYSYHPSSPAVHSVPPSHTMAC